MNAQTLSDFCATIEDTTLDPANVYSYSADPATLDDCQPIVVNIFFWGVNRPNGQNDYPEREHTTLEAVANLNIVYNEFGIYFKYRGYEEFDSPAIQNDPNGYYILESTGDFHHLTSWAANNGYKKNDAFNVYAYGWGNGFGGISPGLNATTTGLSSGHLATESRIPVHEIGHNLSIRHTRSCGSNCEHVTRDPNDPNFNADVTADRVVDTAAMPCSFRDPSCDCYPDINPLTCQYTGNGTDCQNNPYQIFPEDLKNAMSNANLCPENLLTMGQGIRAREALIADTQGNYAPTLTTIESLYEPYAGEYYDVGPEQDPKDKPLFQPGFNYKFYRCCCDYPQPSDFNDVSFEYGGVNPILSISKYETDFDVITHPNHTAIWIDMELCDYNGQNVRKCYDNWNRAADDGSVTKFNDGVFNTNVTVMPKDSQSINDPDLVNDLDSGLYKIEKNYNDGSTDETVIHKNNN
ncbi:hypothetical protein [uncultured Marixanthomonas sp.]|uniref:hypothetical protein n=1 Tax=uncultured Marixanthomonas sp. TaxID=757245 RepID=UPI0030D76DC8